MSSTVRNIYVNSLCRVANATEERIHDDEQKSIEEVGGSSHVQWNRKRISFYSHSSLTENG